MKRQFTHLIISALALSATYSYSAAPAPLTRRAIIAQSLQNTKDQYLADVTARGAAATADELATWQVNRYVDRYRRSSPTGGESAPTGVSMEKYTIKTMLIQKRCDVLGAAIFGTPAQEAEILQEQSITIRNTFPPKI